jgi:DtxR family transcriptional regulator, manganese transport regulator
VRRVSAAGRPVMAIEMPEEPTQARRFGKARTARSAALLEDYVELIANLLAVHGEARATEVAKRLGVAHSTAIKSVARLKREGLVTSRPYRGIFLTEAGRRLADRVRARHRLVVKLLLAVGVPAEAAEADAEGMELMLRKRRRRPSPSFLPLTDQLDPEAGSPDQNSLAWAK